MITATYFGEITELDSRAVWYSDEEDEDEPFDKIEQQPLRPTSHDTQRSKVDINFCRSSAKLGVKISTCIISLSSTDFKNSRINELSFLGSFDSYGKAFLCPVNKGVDGQDKYLLWLWFDANDHHIAGREVGYFVENLREKLQSEFNLDQESQILILSQQFSTNEHLEYLSNSKMNLTTAPFKGQPLRTPSLIKNQFESALFEQLTMLLISAVVVCLPNPKNFWFDKTTNWPSVPSEIIEHKLNDDSLEKTLIFT